MKKITDITWPITSTAILALIIIIGIIAIWKKLKDKQSGYPTTDERTTKVTWKAAYYSMFITQYFIVAFLMLTLIGQEFFAMPEFEAGYPMIAALMVSAVSFIVLRLLLERKGEP